MIIWFANRPRGHVHRCANASVVTEFLLLYGLPVFPTHTSSLCLEAADGTVHIVPTRRYIGASIAAAYLRSWSVLGAVAFTIAAPFSSHSLLLGGAAAASVVVALVSFGRVGALGAAETARRLLYAEHTGYAIDAKLATPGPWLEKLEAAAVERARELAPRAYREGGGGWRDVALHDDVRDREFLCAAMTLSRIELGRAANRGDHVAASAVHDRIFERLVSIDPAVMHRSDERAPPLSRFAKTIDAGPPAVRTDTPIAPPRAPGTASPSSNSTRVRWIGAALFVVCGLLLSVTLALSRQGDARALLTLPLGMVGIPMMLFGQPRNAKGDVPAWWAGTIAGFLLLGEAVGVVLMFG